VEHTLVTLSSKQVGELRRVARKRGVSAADLIARWELALAAIGGFNSGRSDISERHDDFFAEAVDRRPR
jgi:hypothetical protein